MLEYEKLDKSPVAEIASVYLITGEESLLIKRFVQKASVKTGARQYGRF